MFLFLSPSQVDLLTIELFNATEAMNQLREQVRDHSCQDHFRTSSNPVRTPRQQAIPPSVQTRVLSPSAVASRPTVTATAVPFSGNDDDDDDDETQAPAEELERLRQRHEQAVKEKGQLRKDDADQEDLFGSAIVITDSLEDILQSVEREFAREKEQAAAAAAADANQGDSRMEKGARPIPPRSEVHQGEAVEDLVRETCEEEEEEITGTQQQQQQTLAAETLNFDFVDRLEGRLGGTWGNDDEDQLDGDNGGDVGGRGDADADDKQVLVVVPETQQPSDFIPSSSTAAARRALKRTIQSEDEETDTREIGACTEHPLSPAPTPAKRVLPTSLTTPAPTASSPAKKRRRVLFVGESEEGIATNTSLPTFSQSPAENPNTTDQEKSAPTAPPASSPIRAQASSPSRDVMAKENRQSPAEDVKTKERTRKESWKRSQVTNRLRRLATTDEDLRKVLVTMMRRAQEQLASHDQQQQPQTRPRKSSSGKRRQQQQRKASPHFDLRTRTMEETVKEGCEWLLTVMDFASSQQ